MLSSDAVVIEISSDDDGPAVLPPAAPLSHAAPSCDTAKKSDYGSPWTLKESPDTSGLVSSISKKRRVKGKRRSTISSLGIASYESSDDDLPSMLHLPGTPKAMLRKPESPLRKTQKPDSPAVVRKALRDTNQATALVIEIPDSADSSPDPPSKVALWANEMRKPRFRDTKEHTRKTIVEKTQPTSYKKFAILESSDVSLRDLAPKASRRKPTAAESHQALLDKTFEKELKSQKKRKAEEEREKRKEAAAAEKKLKAARKAQQKAEAKAVKEQEKIRSSLQRKISKTKTSKELLSQMTVYIDKELLTNNLYILPTLDEAGASVKEATTHAVANAITWTCRLSYLENYGTKLCHRDDPEPMVAIVITAKQAAIWSWEGVLETQIMNIEKTLLARDGKCKVLLILEGLEQYFRKQENAKQREYRSRVLGKEATQSKSKGKAVALPRLQMEQFLIWLQFETSISPRLTNKPEDTATLLVKFTKAIATKAKPTEHFSFHAASVRETKKVTQGTFVGLMALWKQQLKQLPNVSEFVAESIVSHYPSPTALREGFLRNGPMMLSGVRVRRGASERQIGKTLSTRLYDFFTSEDPDRILD